MTRQNLDDLFLAFAGKGHYLLTTDDLLQLLELHDDAGRPIIRVIDTARCELLGATVEPWRPALPSLIARARDLWIWRLDDIDRPQWLPDFEFGQGSISDD